MFDGVGDEQCFVLRIVSGIEPEHVARIGFGPEPLALAFFVAGHQGARGFQNVLGRTVILL